MSITAAAGGIEWAHCRHAQASTDMSKGLPNVPTTQACYRM